MAIKEQNVADSFSLLMVIAYFLETIAVVLFLAMAFGMSEQSSEGMLAALERIGMLVLVAWLVRRIDKVLKISINALDEPLGRLFRFLTNVAPAGSSTYEPIELKDLCSWHKNSLYFAIWAIGLVSLAAVVIFSMYSLNEGSPVTSANWDWTYSITMPILGICLAWMLATLLPCATAMRQTKRLSLSVRLTYPRDHRPSGQSSKMVLSTEVIRPIDS